MIAQEAQQAESAKQAKLKAARDKVATLQQSDPGSAALVQAESELAALEGELVTGLKPVKLAPRRRGGGGRGRGRGRGQGGK